MKAILSSAATVLSATALVACGGGDDDDAGNSAPPSDDTVRSFSALITTTSGNSCFREDEYTTLFFQVAYTLRDGGGNVLAVGKSDEIGRLGDRPVSAGLVIKEAPNFECELRLPITPSKNADFYQLEVAQEDAGLLINSGMRFSGSVTFAHGQVAKVALRE